MKIDRHQPIDNNERYVATFGRSEKLQIEQNTLLGVTDTETGNYTCLEQLAGTFYEDQIFSALGRTEYGETLHEATPVDDSYHSEKELEIIAEGLEPENDELVEEYGVDRAFEKLEVGHPESRETSSSELPDSAKAIKKSKHFN